MKSDPHCDTSKAYKQILHDLNHDLVLFQRKKTNDWLVGCFGFNGPLTQYFSLYRAVSQRAGERGEKGWIRVKMSKQPPPAPTARAVGPSPTIIQIVGRPGTGSLLSTIAPLHHPKKINEAWEVENAKRLYNCSILLPKYKEAHHRIQI